MGFYCLNLETKYIKTRGSAVLLTREAFFNRKEILRHPFFVQIHGQNVPSGGTCEKFLVLYIHTFMVLCSAYN